MKKSIEFLVASLQKSSEFKKVAASPELSRYDKAMTLQHYTPFLKILKLEHGKLKYESEGLAADALEALGGMQNEGK